MVRPVSDVHMAASLTLVLEEYLAESAEPVHCVHAGRNSWPGWFLGFSESSVRLSPKDVWLMGNSVDVY